MNILVIGSGGREHSLCWAITKSDKVRNLYCTPGNGGIKDVATCVNIDVLDHSLVISFCKNNSIKLVVVGPEAPLVDGLADSLRGAGILTFGPSALAAQLEGSKGFTKDLCKKYNIPTAAYGRFLNAEDAKAFTKSKGVPIVIKADGLAAGKGVIIPETIEEALATIDDMFDGSFGEAGAEIVVEEFLVGEEASFFALCDGGNIIPLVTAQDHKRLGEGDVGPNTGGMGAYSPAPIMTPHMIKRTMDEIIYPTVNAMAQEGHPYQGVLFAGLMITDKGPELIEYNCRFGDPECQVLMTRLKSDFVDGLLASAEGNLKNVQMEWKDEVAITVVMAANGYPGSYQQNTLIEGLGEARKMEGVEVFHAGTKIEGDKILAIGGRVLNVTALGTSVKDARDRAYAAIDKIKWNDGFCRKDIGWRAIEREK
ncbi:MAG: phosphoribosylamine--glycine ligase [Sphingomonadales bacterium]